ncbi:SH3 domain-containing protein [Sinisalibacter aestuarii]|uniref:SH3b domain-containing protein n=1 Tax=Sinisalibacter aestuarii TaxID=2949426 RepID=A0ABQ5LZI1_9RHOB|nr:SH3 domain-containing protein [Sinisalibacter aestuarii]GKY90253.1 hypothetical protein STA1M1_41220 [Sinisalibacter aestuarii]
MRIFTKIFSAIVMAAGVASGPASAFGTIDIVPEAAPSLDHAIPPGDPGPDGLILVQAGGPDFWQVTGVSSGDTLNIRSGPSTLNRIIARAPNGAVLRNLGCQGSGNSRWCKVQTRDGSITGWASGAYLRESGGTSTGGSSDVPRLYVRSSGEIEVQWASGCTMLYNANGSRIQSGSSCTRAQRQRADDAVAGYLREQGGGTAEGGGGPSTHLRGTGTVTLGGPLFGHVTSNNGRVYAVILTATTDGFSCTGSIDSLPRRGQTRSTVIHCTNGDTGSAILKNNGNGRYLLTFSAGGKGGLVTLQ